jgi:hypothetical protein
LKKRKGLLFAFFCRKKAPSFYPKAELLEREEPPFPSFPNLIIRLGISRLLAFL